VSKKAWIIFAAICVVLLAGLVYLSNKDKIVVDGVNVLKTQSASQASGDIGDHVFGKKDSKVTLIEYGDFQCPGCGSAYPNLKAVSEKYEGQLTFVFRNFPLTSIHPNARAAAAVAEAAGLQGRYWDMHNKLYESQSSWSSLDASQRTDFFVGYAKDLGLNVDTFKKDLSNQKVGQKIDFDIALGKKAGVVGTPTIYLNGKAVDSAIWNDKSQLDATIVQAFKTAGVTLPANTAN
jgi:protein-disulfide isomerase